MLSRDRIRCEEVSQHAAELVNMRQDNPRSVISKLKPTNNFVEWATKVHFNMGRSKHSKTKFARESLRPNLNSIASTQGVTWGGDIINQNIVAIADKSAKISLSNRLLIRVFSSKTFQQWPLKCRGFKEGKCRLNISNRQCTRFASPTDKFSNGEIRF